MELKPVQMMQIGGGVLMLISPLLDWIGQSEAGFSFGFAGTETDVFGLQGIITLLVGLAVGGVAAIKAFAPDVALPDEIAGMSLTKLLSIDSAAVFLMTLGLVFVGGPAGPQIGLFLGIIGGALGAAGLFMNDDGPAVAKPAAPPTSF